MLVWPGETVRIAIEFSHDFEGEQLYLFHCHILEHEDAGMMINYKVVDPHGLGTGGGEPWARYLTVTQGFCLRSGC